MALVLNTNSYVTVANADTYFETRIDSANWTQTYDEIKEQALHLVNNEDLLAQTTQTYESISIGNISVSDSNNDVTRTSITPNFVIKPLRPLIRRGSFGMGSSWWRAN